MIKLTQHITNPHPCGKASKEDHPCLEALILHHARYIESKKYELINNEQINLRAFSGVFNEFRRNSFISRI